MNYTPDQLHALGIRFGKNVVVHQTVQFFGAEQITLGDNVRIDCFCVLSARKPVSLGNYVHLGVGVNIFGSEGVVIHDFAGLSSRATIFTASDDYTEGYLTGPTVPENFKKVTCGQVVLNSHAIVGASSVIMPGVTLARGAAVGALSFVTRDVPEFAVVAGHPAREVGKRNRVRLDALEQNFLASARKHHG
jgi:dTDP-4-amino-4,6-dideoxy-D-glucose acyltransferase